MFLWVADWVNGDVLNLFCTLVWAAWLCRNKAIFGGEEVADLVGVAMGYVKHSADYCLYNARVKVSSTWPSLGIYNESWKPPAAPAVKVNVVAHIMNGVGVSYGVVIRDDVGKLLVTAVKRLEVRWSAELAEAGAAAYGVQLAKRFGYDDIVLEFDAMGVVNAINSENKGAAPVFHFYDDIHPNPDAVVQQVQRRILASTSKVEINDQQSCGTGNPIDDCWRCDPNWGSNRQRLADCAIGFGQGATGGKGGQIYMVTDSSDNDVAEPKPGTLRFAAIQVEPLWIIFLADMQIKLSHELIVSSFKTIDGRGANVYITGNGCITLQDVSNVIIHNIHVYNCNPSGSADVRLSPTRVEHKGKSDGDGISISASRNIWVDHCAVSHCTDGLIDVTMGSTAITISNNYFSHHDKVMLLGHSDKYALDKGMQVTIAFNHFGVQLIQRMPRCRHGYFHVVNNDFTEWKMYAIGGSADPTIISQGNRYTAPNDASSKQVTRRLDTDEGDWEGWDWRSDGDLMVNGAYFVPSGQGLSGIYSMDTGAEPKSAAMIDQLTSNAGVLGGPRDNGDQMPQIGGTSPGEIGSSGGMTFGDGSDMIFGSAGPPPSPNTCIFFTILIIVILEIIASNGAVLPLALL